MKLVLISAVSLISRLSDLGDSETSTKFEHFFVKIPLININFRTKISEAGTKCSTDISAISTNFSANSNKFSATI